MSSSSFANRRLRPGALGDIEQKHAAGVAHFGGEFAGQPAADVVFGQQDFRRAIEIASARGFAAKEFSGR